MQASLKTSVIIEKRTSNFPDFCLHYYFFPFCSHCDVHYLHDLEKVFSFCFLILLLLLINLSFNPLQSQHLVLIFVKLKISISKLWNSFSEALRSQNLQLTFHFLRKTLKAFCRKHIIYLLI